MFDLIVDKDLLDAIILQKRFKLVQTLIQMDAIARIEQVRGIDDRIHGGHEIDGHFMRKHGFGEAPTDGDANTSEPKADLTKDNVVIDGK